MHRLCWTMGIVVLVFAGTLVFRLPAMRSEAWSGNEASTSFYLNHQHVQAQPEGKRESFAGHTPLGSLEVQAVSDPEQKDWACWLPDGTPWCPQRQHPLPPGVSQRRPSRAVPEFLSLRKPDDKITRGVIFYLAGYGDLQTNLDYLRFECYVTNRGMEQPCADYRFGYQGRKNNRRGFVAGVPAEATAARVRLGVLAGKWEDTDAAWIWISDPRKLKPKSIRHADEDWDVSIRDVEATAGGLSASFTCLLRWNGTPRLVAVDAEGKVHEPVWPGGDAYSILAATREMMGFRIGHTLSFPGMDLAQLRELRFQIQPYVWTEFRNISLQPGQHTQVEIVDAGAK